MPRVCRGSRASFGGNGALVKLLLDENLSRRIIPFHATHFPGSTQVALIGLETASDAEIWAYARDNDFCIVTKDADFYDLSLIKGAPPKVVWLKSGNATRVSVVQTLLKNCTQIEEMLAADVLNCIELF